MEQNNLIGYLFELFYLDNSEYLQDLCDIFRKLSMKGDVRMVMRMYKKGKLMKLFFNCLASDSSELIVKALKSIKTALNFGRKNGPEYNNQILKTTTYNNERRSLERLL